MPQAHGKIAVALAAFVATAAAGAQAAAPGQGSVAFVTEKRAYLDRGSADGLQARQSLSLLRGGRAATTCTVETVVEHQATCTGGRARAGDTFRLPARGGRAARAQPAVATLPPVVGEETLRARAVAVAEAPYEKVDFTGTRAFRAHTTAAVSPGFTIWYSRPDSPGDYAQERIDGSIQALEIGASGLRLDASFSAMRWQAPPGLDRFRPNAETQFYLWEAEMSRRHADANTVFAVGRLWPWHAPGLSILDGFQLGRRNERQTAEGGIYAGLLPQALTLAPTTDTWATGVYGALTQTGGSKSMFRLARQEARLGIWRAPASGLVGEGEAFAQAWVGPLSLGGGGRLRLAPDISPQPVVDRAYLDLGVRPTLTLGGALHVRYFGVLLPDGAPLRAEVPALAGSFHALADAHWDPVPWLGVAGYGGADRDRATGRSLIHGAAELRLPRLLGVGGLWVGAEADEGWMTGRDVYMQVVGRLRDRGQLLARASYSATRFETPVSAVNLHELGGYFHLDAAVVSWARLRGWTLLRAPLYVQGEPPGGGAGGVMAGLSLTGAF